MADKRNIVIKVNYPVSGKVERHLAPRIITEWNVKRIAFAAGAVILVLLSLIYFSNREGQKLESDNVVLALPEIKKEVSPPLDIKDSVIKNTESVRSLGSEVKPSVNPNKELSHKNKQTPGPESVKKSVIEKNTKGHDPINNVTRSLLTYSVSNKEPAGEIAGTVKISGKKPTWIYYFTEIKAMKGGQVHHEWLKNGSRVSRQSIDILGDTWRTSSRKLLSEQDKGKWTVRMFDQTNRILSEKTFEVK
ncbi:MAG: DUF2914 domain-containing protein [Methylobacter sp.]|nr:DUF2914 domain-containing protein [Methylobacter sp.]